MESPWPIGGEGGCMVGVGVLPVTNRQQHHSREIASGIGKLRGLASLDKGRNFTSLGSNALHYNL